MNVLSILEQKKSEGNLKGELREDKKRLQEIASIIKKYEIVREGLNPEKLNHLLEDLGPTFVKLGQIMSKRTDILPKAYCKELEKLCAESKPLLLLDIVDVLEAEFARPLDDVFDSFEEVPLGSASIGQVHAATLKDGRKVVVKVQRPGVAEKMKEDIMLLRKIAKPLEFAPGAGGVLDFHSLIEELWKVSQQELDYRIEAENTKIFYRNNHSVAGVRCPVIEESLTTSKVMTMEFIDGYSIAKTELLEADGYDREELGYRMTENYIKQVLGDGFFHADPHQGNIMVSHGDLVWIDMGMVGTFTRQERMIIEKGVWAITRKDKGEIIKALTSLGAVTGELNYSKLYRDLDLLLNKYSDADLGELNLGLLLEEIIRIMSDNEIQLPSNISMLARGLITIEGVIGVVSPNTNAIEIARKFIKKDMMRNHELLKELKEDIGEATISAKKSLGIPTLASDLLESTLKGQTRVNLDIVGSESLVDSVNYIMNNLITCILAASLLISSSMICTTEMEPQLFGIPALGFAGYLSAFVLGIVLIIKAHKKGKK